MLKIENITKSYKKKNEEIIILNNVNYEFKRGNIYCIIGKSGVGKTTLIQILGLLLDCNTGNIYIDNKNISDMNDNQKSEIRNKRIGFIFQSYYLNPLLKSFENVMLPMYINNKICDYKKTAYELLEKLGLKGRETHFPKELSGGEQQRVAIARALANNPDIILADEPTGALDYESAINILNILKKLSKANKCVIIVSHDPKVKEYADIVLKIENQQIEEEKL